VDPMDDGEQPNGEATTIGAVAYEEEGKRLILSVAGDLSNDGLASDMLTDILATAPEHADAVRQIDAVSEKLGRAVHVDHSAVVDVVTLDPTERAARD